MTEVKKYIMMICAMLFITIYNQSYTFGYNDPHSAINPLEKITTTLHKNEMKPTSWSLYSREQWGMKSRKQVHTTIQELQMKTNHFTWSINQTDEKIEAIAKRTTDQHNIKEKLIFIAHPVSGKYQTYIIYEVTGDHVSEQHWNHLNTLYQSRIKQFFQHRVKSFTTVEAVTNEKVEEDLSINANHLATQFSAEIVESLKEETFVSLSAYTNEWKNEIPTKNGKMNIQIALRQQGMGGTTFVTIGTPIITTEY